MPIFGITASSNMSIKLTDFYQIATTTLGSAQSNITFSNIPADYTHLQLRLLVRSTNTTDATGAYINIGFNSDTSTIYNYHVLKGNGSTVEAGALTGQGAIYAERIAGNNQTANVFSPGVIDILDYKDTNKFKVTRTLLGFDANGQGQVAINSGLWRSTSAITSITITPPANNFAQYSSFQLYGVKA